LALCWGAARRVDGLERTRRRRAFYRRLSRECRLQRSETFERCIAVRLRRLVAGAISAVTGGEELEERMRLVERDQLGLPRGANQLLARERRVANERLQ
jgi:hypothetical protein